jgi:hypothetical protein
LFKDQLDADLLILKLTAFEFILASRFDLILKFEFRAGREILNIVRQVIRRWQRLTANRGLASGEEYSRRRSGKAGQQDPSSLCRCLHGLTPSFNGFQTESMQRHPPTDLPFRTFSSDMVFIDRFRH